MSASKEVKLRVQQKPLKKGGKMKPALTVAWKVGMDASYPIGLVQRHFPKCQSLRKGDDEEYTWEDLFRLDKPKGRSNTIVYASCLPSQLKDTKKNAVREKLSLFAQGEENEDILKQAQQGLFHPTINCPRCVSYIKSGLKLSRHAMERCCERELSVQDIEYALEHGNWQNANNKKKESAATSMSFNIFDLVVVQGKNGMIITAYEEEPFVGSSRMTEKAGNEESQEAPSENNEVPCHPELARQMKLAGIFSNFEKMRVLVTFNQSRRILELGGNAKKFKRFRSFLNDCIVRIPWKTDVVAILIGKKGERINELKRTIDVTRISVFWDEEKKEIVFFSALGLSAQTTQIHEFFTRHCGQKGPETEVATIPVL